MRFLLIASLFFNLCLLSFASDWPQWRGPQRDGSARFHAPATWPQQPQQQWQTQVGDGYGSPVLAAGRLFVLTGDGNKEFVTAIAADSGEVLWVFDYPIDFKPNGYALKFGKGPFATPLVVDGRVYTVGVSGQVYCLQASDGQVLWHHGFDGDLDDDRLLFCGNTVSPLLVDNKVIVHVGNETQGRMLALDAQSGKVHWRWDGDIPGYASPDLFTFHDTPQIVALCQNDLVGIDPATGEQLWRYGFQVKWRENIVNPLAVNDLLIISGREQGEIRALKPTQRDGQWHVEQAWSTPDQVMYMSSPIVHQNTLYGMAHKQKGHFFALDTATGRTLWTGPGRMGDHASLLNADDLLITLTTAGTLRFLALDKTAFQPVATYQVGASPTWALPAVDRNTLFIKDKDTLYSLAF